MNDPPKTKRRWYQFSLRTMFVLVVVVSIPMAWVGFQFNWIRQRRQWLRGHAHTTVDPPTPIPASLAIFGETGVQSTWYFPGEEAEARRLFPEAIIRPDAE
jgi:hypothetical protein